ncbi:MAG: hypothetical protein KDK78_07135 [Chlamydiia bacterium]|nr:hypothetical protein [Chlamydiia bacterium]
MIDCSRLISALENSGSISINGEEIEKDSKLARLGRALYSPYDSQQKARVCYIAYKHLQEQPQSEEAQKLAKLCIQRYGKDKAVRRLTERLDRVLAEMAPETHLPLAPRHAELCRKWQRNGWDLEIFNRFPDFANFLLVESPLGSQMKVTRDVPSVREGVPGFLVQGEWMSFSDFKERFEVLYSPRYRENFIMSKGTSDVYTFLDNGLGLEPFHPYQSPQPKSISTLNDADLATVQAKARQFVRVGEERLSPEEREKRNAERDYVLQIVSSKVDGGSSNFSRLVSNRKHPWIRIICGRDNQKGQVFEVGYGWDKKIYLPSAMGRGALRAMDVWNNQSCKQRVVTNIALTQAEVQELYKPVSKFHKQDIQLGRDIGFSLAHQNCSVFVRWAVGLTGIAVPTEITAVELLARVAPNWIRGIGSAYSAARRGIIRAADRMTFWAPKWVRRIGANTAGWLESTAHKIAGLWAAAGLALGRLVFGGAFGSPARAFGDPQEDEMMSPPSKNLKKAWNWRDYRFNLPGILQEWQEKQASTVYYDNPLKLSIVP